MSDSTQSRSDKLLVLYRQVGSLLVAARCCILPVCCGAWEADLRAGLYQTVIW